MTVDFGVLATFIVIIFGGVAIARLLRGYFPDVVAFLLLGITIRFFSDLLGIFAGEFLSELMTSFAGIGIMVIGLLTVMFVSGLETEWSEFIKTLKTSLLLATLGVLVTTILIGILAGVILGIGITLALLIGAVLAPTDPTIILPMLKRLKVSRKVKSILRSESTLDDAMAVALTFTFLELLIGQAEMASIIPFFGWQFLGGITIGVAVGYAMGMLMGRVSRRPAEMNIMSLFVPVVSFALAEWAGSNGFLAALFAGLFIGNVREAPYRIITPIKRLPKKRLLDFWENIWFLVEIVVFTSLGAMIDLGRLGGIVLTGLALWIVLLVVARPVSVFTCTRLERTLTNRERTFMVFAGMRATVPAILALAVAASGIPGTGVVLDIALVVVLLSAIVQSVMLGPVTRRLWVHGK